MKPFTTLIEVTYFAETEKKAVIKAETVSMIINRSGYPATVLQVKAGDKVIHGKDETK